jgi:UDP-glucuronate 4-epimerase
MAHVYSYSFNLPTTGLRFFTVYGPWGRPDMAYYSFTERILRDEPITIYNQGKMQRDFTYVDDIVTSLLKVADQPPVSNEFWDGNDPDPANSSAPYKIYNIGNNNSVNLMDFVHILEELIGKKAIIQFGEKPVGDVIATHADISELAHDVGFHPSTQLKEGLKHFIDWHRNYSL